MSLTHRELATTHRALAAKEPHPEVAAAHIRFAEGHESKMQAHQGWASAELAEAYHAVEKVMTSEAQPVESGINDALKAALEAIEDADCELGKFK